MRNKYYSQQRDAGWTGPVRLFLRTFNCSRYVPGGRSACLPPKIPKHLCLFGDQIRHLLRKKQIRFFQASHTLRTRKCSIQPLRPLDAEECIFQTPHHSRGTFPSMQLVADRNQQIFFHGNRVLAHLRLLKRSFRERPEIDFDGLVLKLFRIRIG